MGCRVAISYCEKIGLVGPGITKYKRKLLRIFIKIQYTSTKSLLYFTQAISNRSKIFSL
jgi:hypothetical protein